MSDFKIGQRVRISPVSAPANQPFPEHEGKEGSITGVEPIKFMSRKIDVPIITLDDGTILKGYECWWEPI